MHAIWTIFSYIGATVIGLGVVTTVAYWIFQQFASRWLQSKFDKQLETFRGEQMRELERLRAQINREFDRARKVHEKEFDILPEAWSRFVIAHDHVVSFVHPFQQYPDLGRMSTAELEEFLAGTSLSGTQKDDIRNCENKTDKYIKIIFFHRHAETMGVMRDFNRYFRNNGIFIHPDLSKKFQRLLDMMHSAVLEHHMNETEKVRPRMREEGKKLKDGGETLFEEIKQNVQAQLWETRSEQVSE